MHAAIYTLYLMIKSHGYCQCGSCSLHLKNYTLIVVSFMHMDAWIIASYYLYSYMLLAT